MEVRSAGIMPLFVRRGRIVVHEEALELLDRQT